MVNMKFQEFKARAKAFWAEKSQTGRYLIIACGGILIGLLLSFIG